MKRPFTIDDLPEKARWCWPLLEEGMARGFMMFRRSLSNSTSKHRVEQLANRLTKILAETRKLKPTGT